MAELKLNYIGAVNKALERALRENPNVIVFGEDVGVPGGVFGATKGLQSQFGADRVFDTPISESVILGGALGTTMAGYRPVAEIMWTDFSLVALDQIVNQAANVRYVSEGRYSAPLTVRMQQGTLPGACAQHSQSLEAIFAHIPGILVGLPATVADAHDMLLSAIACDDPTVIIEHRSLYFGAAESIEVDRPVAPVGGAAIRRPGKDLTLVTWGPMLITALAAAELLAAESLDVEVIDARWLTPFDDGLVGDSVTRTNRLLIVHEANVTGGFGAEVAARVARDRFSYLDAPPTRLGLPDVRVPAAPGLLRALIPGAQEVANAAREVMTY